MILPPIIPVILLILGALAVAASDLARLRRPSLVMIVTAIGALLVMFTLRSDTPLTQIISAWQPVSVFTVPISFRVDRTAWILGLGFIVAGLSAAFTWAAYPGRDRPGPRAVSLLLLATAIASVFASNLLTLALTWGLFDLVFVAAVLLRSGPQLGRRAATAIVLNATSTVCVWIATLLIENAHDSLYWHLIDLAAGPAGWLAAAAVLRLGVYPLHQWLPIELEQGPDRAALLFSIPPAVGLALWARLALTQNLPPTSIVPQLAIISAMVGGILAWQSSPAPRSWSYIALSLASLAVVQVGSVGAEGPSGMLTVAALNFLFMVVSLFIARSFTWRAPWWSASAIVASLSIAGVPGTLGFIVRQQTLVGLTQSNNWLWLVGCVLAETLLIAAVLRTGFTPQDAAPPTGVLRRISFGLGLATSALPLIALPLVAGWLPLVPSLSTLFGRMTGISWLAWLAPIVLGVLLAWRAPRLAASAPETAGSTPIWVSVLRLDWLNAALSFLMQRLTTVLRGLASVIEGEGGLIWAIIIIIVGLVLNTGVFK